QRRRSIKDVDRRLVVLVLIRRIAPEEARRRGAMKRVDEQNACADRLEQRAIGHMDLTTPARGLRVFVKRRLENGGTEVQARHPPTARRPARTAWWCRGLPTRSSLRTAPCRGRRWRCRASADSATAAPTAGSCHRRTCRAASPAS